jgi:hypothetical protein
MNAADLFANAKNSLLSRAVPGYRPGQRVIARSTAVFAVSVMTTGLAIASASPASAGPLHAMTIDATALSSDAINIARGYRDSPFDDLGYHGQPPRRSNHFQRRWRLFLLPAFGHRHGYMEPPRCLRRSRLGRRYLHAQAHRPADNIGCQRPVHGSRPGCLR